MAELQRDSPERGVTVGPQGIGWKPAFRFFTFLVLAPAVLFLVAGRFDWWQAWVYLALYLSVSLGSRAFILRKYPDLIRERARFTRAEGVKSWDKALLPFLVYGPIVTLVVAALDMRFDWGPPVPVGLQLSGIVVIVVGTGVSVWAMAVNRYFSSVVRIQKDRGHCVVTSGPYRVVRHPGYLGGILASAATPVQLGSLWALLPAGLVVALLALRTAWEDRALQEELPGYREYTLQTRYRLVPGFW